MEQKQARDDGGLVVAPGVAELSSSALPSRSRGKIVEAVRGGRRKRGASAEPRSSKRPRRDVGAPMRFLT